MYRDSPIITIFFPSTAVRMRSRSEEFKDEAGGNSAISVFTGFLTSGVEHEDVVRTSNNKSRSFIRGNAIAWRYSDPECRSSRPIESAGFRSLSNQRLFSRLSRAREESRSVDQQLKSSVRVQRFREQEALG